MAPLGVEVHRCPSQRPRAYPDATANTLRQGRAALVDPDVEAIAIPAQLARTDDQLAAVAVELLAPPLGHRPGPAIFPVERDVERAEVLGLGMPAAACPGVVGRKDAADERDDGDAVIAVIAQRIDVPPEIALWAQRLVETWSAVRLAAASRPERAAIGTPGPGCALPPARYSPGTLVRAPGRENEAIQP